MKIIYWPFYGIFSCIGVVCLGSLIVFGASAVALETSQKYCQKHKIFQPSVGWNNMVAKFIFRQNK